MNDCVLYSLGFIMAIELPVGISGNCN